MADDDRSATIEATMRHARAMARAGKPRSENPWRSKDKALAAIWDVTWFGAGGMRAENQPGPVRRFLRRVWEGDGT